MNKIYSSCTLCPRMCCVDRNVSKGFCRMSSQLRVARAALHFWEEPCLSGENGSGTVFFSGCQLGCVFCQNGTISRGCNGIDISVQRLSDIFFELREKGAHNINLVSGTQFVPDIIEALDNAKKSGFDLPVIYNCGGYESIDTLHMLRGYIDIFLPDFKYMSKKLSKTYSKAENYAYYAKLAVNEMLEQTGKPAFDKNGIMKKGTIVRHLILPECTEDSKTVIEYLHKKYGDDLWLSIMNQYTPPENMNGNLSRTLTSREYDEVIDFAVAIGVENAFIQDGDTADESFIPAFDYEGVLPEI